LERDWTSQASFSSLHVKMRFQLAGGRAINPEKVLRIVRTISVERYKLLAAEGFDRYGVFFLCSVQHMWDKPEVCI
jgi:hypothetical protein